MHVLKVSYNKKDVNYIQNVNGLTDFINFR